MVSGENEGLLFLRASNNKVGDATRGGRVPFCASTVLLSLQNTYTHNPLSDTPDLHYDRLEFDFHSECQPFSTLSAHCLVSFKVTSLLFPS